MIIYLDHALRIASVRIRMVTTGMIAVSFLGLSSMIYDLKNTNTKVLNEKVVWLTAFLRSCPEPCSVDVAEISKGLVRGGVFAQRLCGLFYCLD